jgi:threonine dehydrogenase-like Zn-dependent dehydrogenase
MLGAERIVAIDRVPERLALALAKAGATDAINYEERDVRETLLELTGGVGPDACIDAVGTEAHIPGPLYAYDRIKQAMMLESDRAFALPSCP